MSPKKVPQIEPENAEDQASSVHIPNSVEGRADRLARVKRAIDNGTYRISADKIADRVIYRLKKKPPEA